MNISSHARKEMEHSIITEGEVRECLQYGQLVIKQLVQGEKRYGKQIEFKNKRIVVIYTYENQEEKVITMYPIRRKKEW